MHWGYPPSIAIKFAALKQRLDAAYWNQINKIDDVYVQIRQRSR